MWQRGDVAAFALLPQQFVNEGFVDVEKGRNFPLSAKAAFNSVHETLS